MSKKKLFWHNLKWWAVSLTLNLVVVDGVFAFSHTNHPRVGVMVLAISLPLAICSVHLVVWADTMEKNTP